MTLAWQWRLLQDSQVLFLESYRTMHVMARQEDNGIRAMT